MSGKPIFICVQKDITYPINWMLKDFDQQIVVKHFNKISELNKALENDDCNILLSYAVVFHQSGNLDASYGR